MNGYLQADYLQNFSIRTNVALDYYLFDTFDYENFEVGDQAGIGTVDRTKDITSSLTWWNQLAFQKSFGEHSVSAKVITEVNNYLFESMDARKAQFPFAGLKEFNGAANTTRLNGFTTPTRLFSVLGTTDYSFKDKYFFNASFRQDASSRFAKKERSAPFLAAGFGWQLSDEGFMSSIGFVNSLKLRGSYGELGNNDIFKANTTTSESDYFPYLQAFEAGHDDGSGAGVFVTRLADPKIGWEKSKMWNVGLDFSVLNSRISGTVETYQKNTFDLIMDRPFPTSKGFGGVIVTNVGDIKNTGVELSLSTVNVKTADFEWTTDFNISFEKNEILKLPEGQEGITTGTKRLVVGKDIYQFFIREWAGVDPSDGAPMWYKDVLDGDDNPTGERTVTKDFSLADKYFSGSALPDARGGFSTAVTYKGFTLSALANFSVGGKILDEDYSNFMHGVNSPGIQLHADNLDRWQQPGDVTSVPRLDLDGNGDVRSTRFLVDNSYLRLRNVTLAYNVTGDLLDKLKVFRTLSVNLKADNLLTISNAKQGLDPEQALNGLTNYRSSIFKTYSFGINIGL
jgi:TonB-linked SusC/RagA family outer membrane protein